MFVPLLLFFAPIVLLVFPMCTLLGFSVSRGFYVAVSIPKYVIFILNLSVLHHFEDVPSSASHLFA